MNHASAWLTVQHEWMKDFGVVLTRHISPVAHYVQKRFPTHRTKHLHVGRMHSHAGGSIFIRTTGEIKGFSVNDKCRLKMLASFHPSPTPPCKSLAASWRVEGTARKRTATMRVGRCSKVTPVRGEMCCIYAHINK